MSFLLGCALFSTWEASCGFRRLETDPPVWPVAGRKLRHPCLKSFPSHSSTLHCSPLRSLLRARDEKDFLWSNSTSLIWASSPATSPTKKTPSKSRGRAGIPLSRPLFLYSFTTVPCSALSSRSLTVMDGDRLSAPHFTSYTEKKQHTHTECKWWRQKKVYLYDAFMIKRQQKVCHIFWIIV